MGMGMTMDLWRGEASWAGEWCAGCPAILIGDACLSVDIARFFTDVFWRS